MLLEPLLLSVLITTAFAAPQVQLGQTTIVGSEFVESKVEFFGGIPFALPPIGDLRLKAPVLTTELNVTSFDATSFGPGCLQTSLPPDLVSEDCLTVSVFRPAGLSPNARLPVMFWIYGGSFVSGATSLYNGTGIVAKSVARRTPVIFVSVNYRLGPLGFPQGAEAGLQNSTNLGLDDQLAGLKWVNANIEKFGGDKSKVTIFGESAGAISINIHLLGQKIKGLARAAIMESTGLLPTYEPQFNQQLWTNYVSAIPECANVAETQDTFSCIRSTSSASLLQALFTAGIFGNASFPPVIDGPAGFLPDVPSRLELELGLPTIIGSNLDEGTLFVPQDVNSADEIRESLIAGSTPSLKGPEALAAAVDRILELYPDTPALGSPFGTGNNTFGLSSQYKRFAAIFGDFIFQSARRVFTKNASNAGDKVFAYHFTDPDAILPPQLEPIPLAPGSLGISHASELAYVFNGLFNPTPSATKLSSIMQDYWISFATSLDPNDGQGDQRPYWERYTTYNKVFMQLDGRGTKIVPDTFREEQIAFINSDPLVFHR